MYAPTDWVLPNGLTVAQVNPWETQALYDEIFLHRCYLQPGVALPRSGAIVDVGANIGLFTLFCHIEAPALPILSLEPSETPRRALESNIRRHGINATVIAAGAGAQPETRPFTYYPAHTDFSGFHAQPHRDHAVAMRSLELEGHLLPSDLAALADRREAERRMCNVIPLSQALTCADIDDVALLKVDAERSEEAILLGITDENWRRIHRIVVEVHDGASAARRVRRALEQRRFRVVVVPDPLETGCLLLHGSRAT